MIYLICPTCLKVVTLTLLPASPCLARPCGLTGGARTSLTSRRMVALLPQEETTEDGMQLAPPGFNAVVLPFADEVREAKTTEEGDVKQEGWLTLISVWAARQRD